MPLFVQTAMVKDMDAGTIQNMGISLTSEDVAQKIYQLANMKTNFLTPTHQPVGLKTKFLFQLSQISPQFINRLTNLALSRKK